jgi:hypothetical protein
MKGTAMKTDIDAKNEIAAKASKMYEDYLIEELKSRGYTVLYGSDQEIWYCIRHQADDRLEDINGLLNSGAFDAAREQACKLVEAMLDRPNSLTMRPQVRKES